jgi:WD40 repeat protein
LSRSAYSHDHRGYLNGHSLGQLKVVGVLNDTPRSFAFSPDGKQLVSGHQYGSVRLWDVDQILEKKTTPKASHTISIGAAG